MAPACTDCACPEQGTGGQSEEFAAICHRGDPVFSVGRRMLLLYSYARGAFAPPFSQPGRIKGPCFGPAPAHKRHEVFRCQGKHARSWNWMPLLAGAVLVCRISSLGSSPAGAGGEPDLGGQAAGRRRQADAAVRPDRARAGIATIKTRRNRSYSPKQTRGDDLPHDRGAVLRQGGQASRSPTIELASERSRNMIKLLGFKDKDATTVDACLRCHALPEVGGDRMHCGVSLRGRDVRGLPRPVSGMGRRASATPQS